MNGGGSLGRHELTSRFTSIVRICSIEWVVFSCSLPQDRGVKAINLPKASLNSRSICINSCADRFTCFSINRFLVWCTSCLILQLRWSRAAAVYLLGLPQSNPAEAAAWSPGLVKPSKSPRHGLLHGAVVWAAEGDFFCGWLRALPLYPQRSHAMGPQSIKVAAQLIRFIGCCLSCLFLKFLVQIWLKWRQLQWPPGQYMLLWGQEAIQRQDSRWWVTRKIWQYPARCIPGRLELQRIWDKGRWAVIFILSSSPLTD